MEHWLAILVIKMLIYLVLQSILICIIIVIFLFTDKPLLSLKIIDRANSYTKRKIKEAVWINKLKSTLNKNTGLELTY